MTDISLLKTLLNCKHLESGWNTSYGITKAHNDSLTNPKSKDSLLNPQSETALTLFMLGNIDCWKQIDALKKQPRLVDSWNKEFFNEIRFSQDVFYKIPNKDVLWGHKRLNDIFGCHASSLRKSILLFEFEIMNDKFHRVWGKTFKELSFLDINNFKKWSKFDAVLIVPEEKLFVFFESKLKGDTASTTQFPYVNQIMRNLESAFLLTEHEDSLYNDWRLRYVFICPRKAFEYKSTHYSFVLDSIEDYIAMYKEIINKEYESYINQETYKNYFEYFEQEAPKLIYKLYWDDLGEILQSRDKSFFGNYLDNLEKTGIDRKHLRSIEKRFRDVGMNVT